jgi:hypothetical protein
MLGKAGRTRAVVVDLYGKLKRLEMLKHDAVVSFAKKHKLEHRGWGWGNWVRIGDTVVSR